MMRTNLFRCGLGLAVVSLLAAGPGLASSGDRPQQETVEIHGVAVPTTRAVQEGLDRLLARWQVFEVPHGALAGEARNGAVALRFGDQAFDAVLKPSDLWSPDYRQEWIGPKGAEVSTTPPSGVYRGQLVDRPDSEVRLVATEDYLRGYLREGDDDWFFVDPLERLVPGAPAGQVVLYRAEDVRNTGAALCGAGGYQHDAAGLLDIETDWLPPSSTRNHNDSLNRADVATEADFEFTSAHVNPAAEIAAILNAVDGIYQAEHALTLRVVFQSFWNFAGDPYTSANANTLLNQFRNFWNANRGDVRRDTAHLFTARNLTGTTVGIAWTGVICRNPSFAYGLSEEQGLGFLTNRLVAHEIGHNFNALHDDEITPPADACIGTGPIMCSALQFFGTNTFSGASRAAVARHVRQNHQCLSCLVDNECRNVCDDDWDDCIGWNGGQDDQDVIYCDAQYDDCIDDCCHY